MEERKFCQSCGMPLDRPEDCGSEADGRPSGEYCRYCYQQGAFTWDCTMEQMMEFCLKMDEEPQHYGPPEQARQLLAQWFPTLKRWQQAGAQHGRD